MSIRICAFSRVMQAHRAFYPSLPALLEPQFRDLDVEVTVLTTALPNGGVGWRDEGRARVHYLPGTTADRVDAAFHAAAAAEFDRLHAKRPFDAVFGRGPSVWGFLSQTETGKSARIPLIMHEGTYPHWLHQLERKAPLLRPLLEKPIALAAARKRAIYHKCLQRAAQVVCNSPNLADALVRANWWAPPTTRFIPYGFDIDGYSAADREEEDPPRIVTVARLTWDKGVLDMVETLSRSRHTDARLQMIGPASAKVLAAIRRRAEARGLAHRLSLPGPVHNANLPGHLAGAAVFLFPSTHPEGLSKSVMEAMAARLPVVAYDIPGMSVLVEEAVTGFLVKPGDFSGLADRLDKLLDDPALRTRMGLSARERLRREFSMEAATERWRQLFAEVLGSR